MTFFWNKLSVYSIMTALSWNKVSQISWPVCWVSTYS